ncbi:MAG: hypothetical protein M5R41_00285 [Bacteroidia bacterium]|nr:hypothetical protein [Bacteroidia bacterium]
MSIFDKKGMMIFPTPLPADYRESKHVLVVQECYCQQGHNLINERAQFNQFNGIFLRVRKDHEDGLVALSPVYGDKSRISLGVRLEKGDIFTLLCPECGVTLPVFGQCGCEADLIAIFLTANADFGNCIGLCSRVGCFNAQIQSGNELLTLSSIEQHLH